MARGDRASEAVAAEKRPDPARLALERGRRRRVVKEHDPEVAVRDGLELAVEGARRPRSSRRTPAAGAARRSRAVRSRGSRRRTPSGRRRRPRCPRTSQPQRASLEHAHAGVGQHGDDLVRAVQVPVVVAEHGEHRDRQAAARVGEDRRLLGVAAGGQVAGEQDQIVPGSSDANAASTRSRSDSEAWMSPAAAMRIGAVSTSIVPNAAVTCRSRAGYKAIVPPEPNDLNGMMTTLKHSAAALRDAGVPFLVAGGVASWVRGGPPTDHDLDFLIKPEDAERALAVARRPRLPPGAPARGVALQGVRRRRDGRPDLPAGGARDHRRGDRARRGARGRGDDDARDASPRTCSSRS